MLVYQLVLTFVVWRFEAMKRSEIKLNFDRIGHSASAKTQIWSVSFGGRSLRLSVRLGVVRWYAPWRRYCFYAEANMLFDAKCLTQIAEFCTRATTEHKK